MYNKNNKNKNNNQWVVQELLVAAKNTRVQRRARAIGQGTIFQVNISTIEVNDKGTTITSIGYTRRVK